MKINEEKGVVEMTLPAHFVEKYGSEAQHMADVIQEMAAAGDLDSINAMIRCFCVAVAAGKQILRHVTQKPFVLAIPAKAAASNAVNN